MISLLIGCSERSKSVCVEIVWCMARWFSDVDVFTTSLSASACWI